MLQNTKLGWIATGKIITRENNHSNRVLSCLVRDELSNKLEKFWTMENYGDKVHLSKEEKECEEHFSANVGRDLEGKYIVRLPFNKKIEELGPSFAAAKRRFFALERKLQKDANLKENYITFMKQFEELGHMEAINEIKEDGYYMPHQAVIRESSLTTKLRVVFDASAKTTTGISLNEAMLVGPSVQGTLFFLILRFRQHPVAVSADVEKMFRQFWVHPDDRKFQRIIWRYNTNEPLRTYELKTITYGTASAPFLAVRCLRQLAEDEGANFPRAADALREDFYVDDFLSGGESVEEAKELRDEMISLTSRGRLRLCKWISNCQELMDDFSEETNNISYQRSILSQAAQLYDPLGLVAPVVVYAKIQLQELWKLSINWDDPVPEQIVATWGEYLKQLPTLGRWRIPRAIRRTGVQDLQLHGFADASEKAYGACFYVRWTLQDQHHSILLCSKSRVAPLKSVSLPRLELCSALLLARLYKVVNNSLRLKFEFVRFWSDSTIALAWINSSPHILKTFIANRVSAIQELISSSKWKHVSSAENPADHVSRGQLPEEFINNDQWKNGPSWLRRDKSFWPNHELEEIDIPEKKITTLKVVIKVKCCGIEFHHLLNFCEYSRIA
ncbi:uncharacterized protein LOC127290613 [Leptopilina boulardi]|uniref:uncharacterized protein LOC127290613 n=1 Tax=Leptopilina boulardi TaxID=63433 RepID=UPI0021F689AA|nr:uncharacterized protein LOC127290613 [Leptopilina boulardi]